MKHNWEYRRIDEVCSSRAYSDPIERINGKVWLLNLDMIESKSGAILSKVMCKEDEVYGSVTTFGKDFVLYSKLRPYLNKVVVPETSGYCTTELVPLIPNDDINKYYLSYFLRNTKFVNYINEKASGAKMPRAKMSDFWAVLIPVPQLDVQEQIVVELDKINEIISGCKEAIRNLDALAQSLFYDYFGDPLTNPKGWEIKPLKDVCIDITDGDHSAPPKSDSGIPFITISNIDKERKIIDFANCLYVSQNYFNSLKENRKPRIGDILYTVTGSYGITVEIKDNTPFCFQRHIGIIRPSKAVNSSFIAQWASTDSMKSLADKVATGIAQKTISLTSLRNFQIIMPSMELQEKFAARIKQIEQQKKGLEETIANMQTLLNSRMDYWFN